MAIDAALIFSSLAHQKKRVKKKIKEHEIKKEFLADDLKEITGYVNDIPSKHLKDRPSRFECPESSIKMEEFVFKVPDIILIDNCTQCHGIYLERNELKRIFNCWITRNGM